MPEVVSGLVFYTIATVVTGSPIVGVVSVVAAAAARVAGYPVLLLVLEL